MVIEYLANDFMQGLLTSNFIKYKKGIKDTKDNPMFARHKMYH